MTEALNIEQAAQVLGMKPSEVVDLADADGGTVATTHDGQQTLIRDDGTTQALGGPPPVGEQPEAVSQAISAHLPVDFVAGGVVDAELPGYTLDDVAEFVAERYELDETDVKAALAEEFGDTFPPISPAGQAPDAPAVDEGQAAAPIEDQAPGDGPVAPYEPIPYDADAVPVGTNADVVLEWVGDDVDRARRALEVEATRPTPRGTLVTKLTKVVDGG